MPNSAFKWLSLWQEHFFSFLANYLRMFTAFFCLRARARQAPKRARKDRAKAKRENKQTEKMVSIYLNAENARGIESTDYRHSGWRSRRPRRRSCTCKTQMGRRCRSQSLHPARYTNRRLTVEFTYFGGPISANWDIRVEGKCIDSRGHGRTSDGIRLKSVTARVCTCA